MSKGYPWFEKHKKHAFPPKKEPAKLYTLVICLHSESCDKWTSQGVLKT